MYMMLSHNPSPKIDLSVAAAVTAGGVSLRRMNTPTKTHVPKGVFIAKP